MTHRHLHFDLPEHYGEPLSHRCGTEIQMWGPVGVGLIDVGIDGIGSAQVVRGRNAMSGRDRTY